MWEGCERESDYIKYYQSRLVHDVREIVGNIADGPVGEIVSFKYEEGKITNNLTIKLKDGKGALILLNGYRYYEVFKDAKWPLRLDRTACNWLINAGVMSQEEHQELIRRGVAY